MKENESKLQNKIALSVFYIVTLLTIITLHSQIQDVPLGITTIIYIILFIPCIGFALYLIFLPLEYKTNEKRLLRTINPYSEIVVEKEFIDHWFNMGANWLPLSLTNALTLGLVVEIISNQRVADRLSLLPASIPLIIVALGSFVPGFIIVYVIRKTNGRFISKVKKVNKTTRNTRKPLRYKKFTISEVVKK